MLEWLQMMKLAAGQSDRQGWFFPFFFLKSSLNNRIRQIVCDLCQGFVGNTEASSSHCAGLRHVWICKAPLVFVFLFHARFQHENVKLFGNLLPRRAFMERSLIELSSARMFDAASLVEHMPHSVLGRPLFVRWPFFTGLQLWPWGGRAGQGQQLSGPLWALWHAWPGQKHKVSKK